MIVVPFISCHLDDISLQDGQSEMVEFLETEGYAEMLEGIMDSYSVFNDDGVFMGCGGLAAQSSHRALAWSLISSKCCGNDMIALTRIVKRYLSETKYDRIEAVVRDGFEQGHRWIKLLGFECETPNGMKNWIGSGKNAYLYARGK